MRRAGKSRLCVVASPYRPFGRADEFGKELTINYKVMDRIMAAYPDLFYIQVGKEPPIHFLSNIDLNLNFKTTPADLMDIVSISEICLCQIGHMLPVAESLNKKVFVIFAENGFKSQSKFITAITPGKTICKRSSEYCVDTEPQDVINKRFGKML